MKPHRTDGVSLSFGLIFLLIALWWAISRVVTVHLPTVGWLIAGGLIVFGVIGLMGAIRSGRTTAPAVTTAPPAPAEPALSGDLTPDVHASIVRELLDDPATRFEQDHPGGVTDRPRQD